MDGAVHEVEAGCQLRFERQLPHPPEQVWNELTAPDRLVHWLAGEGASIEPHVEGAVTLPTWGGTITGRVTAWMPPTLLAYTWHADPADPATVVSFGVDPAEDGGTSLVLAHTLPLDAPADDRRLGLAGWDTLLERLACSLAGSPIPFSKERWDQAYEAYGPSSTE